MKSQIEKKKQSLELLIPILNKTGGYQFLLALLEGENHVYYNKINS